MDALLLHHGVQGSAYTLLVCVQGDKGAIQEQLQSADQDAEKTNDFQVWKGWAGISSRGEGSLNVETSGFTSYALESPPSFAKL